MKVQVNSDRTVTTDDATKRAIESDVDRILERFATKLTRVEIHLSDIDNKKTGRPDKRCLVEVRPAGAQPRTASAIASEIPTAVSQALRKMQSGLTTFFGRQGRSEKAPAKDMAAPAPPAKTQAAAKAATPEKAPAVKKRVGVKKTAAAKKQSASSQSASSQSKLSPRGPKKKAIFQARRKSWPK